MLIESVINHLKTPPKMSWFRYFVQAIAWTLIVVLVLYLFSLRFSFGVDYQTTTSVMGARLFLIDHKDKSLDKNKYFAFDSPDLAPFFVENTTFIKSYVAGPGDKIEISNSTQIFINDQPTVYMGLDYAADRLGTTKEAFIGTVTLKDNQFWMLGDSPKSFDSRYWGPITQQRVIGRAYRII